MMKTPLVVLALSLTCVSKVGGKHFLVKTKERVITNQVSKKYAADEERGADYGESQAAINKNTAPFPGTCTTSLSGPKACNTLADNNCNEGEWYFPVKWYDVRNSTWDRATCCCQCSRPDKDGQESCQEFPTTTSTTEIGAQTDELNPSSEPTTKEIGAQTDELNPSSEPTTKAINKNTTPFPGTCTAINNGTKDYCLLTENNCNGGEGYSPLNFYWPGNRATCCCQCWPAGNDSCGHLSCQDEFPITTSTTEFRNGVLAATNDFRRGQGKDDLRKSTKLDRFAQEWADHLVARGDCQLEHSNRTGLGYGENMIVEPTLSVQEAVDGWKNSTGHRENLLRDYSKMGVGLANLKSQCNCFWVGVAVYQY